MLKNILVIKKTRVTNSGRAGLKAVESEFCLDSQYKQGLLRLHLYFLSINRQKMNKQKLIRNVSFFSQI